MERGSASASPSVEELTSGASARIIPVFRSLRCLLRVFVFLHSLCISFLLLARRKGRIPVSAAPLSSPRRRVGGGFRKAEEEDVRRRRALAESLSMAGTPSDDGGGGDCSGRYAHFARQLTSCNFGVYAMDWIGHGGSDGLHGYVPSLDYVVADTTIFLERIRSENPGIPCFLLGHSTGGAVVLKATLNSHVEAMLEGIILTSPALRVKPAHPIVGAVAPFVSLVLPRFQFKGANKRGIPVSRDPAAMLAKYSDPLVYTGPIRVRTGHEILRISSQLMRNVNSVRIPFLALHGTADRVTDPLATQDLYYEAASTYKNLKLYEGFLHDLLFEPERDEIGADIIEWMQKKLTAA